MRLNQFKRFNSGQGGFSLPLTLLVSLIVTASLVGAVYTAMNSNQRTRFNFLRLLGRTGLDSLRTQYKSLLNDTSGGNIYNYFWIADGCSSQTPPQECPTPVGSTTRLNPGDLQNPSTTVWPDGVWKQGPGRQKAPMCKPNTNQALDWTSPQRAIQQTFYGNGIQLNTSVQPSTTGFVHSYTANEITTTGTAKQQVATLIGGSKSKSSQAGRTAMINLLLARVMSQSGFAFLSAGYNGSENEPIAISNLSITRPYNESSTSGTILLRKNVNRTWDCGSQIRNFRSINSTSPIGGSSENGGLTIFPAKFPSDLASHPKNAGGTNKGTLMLRQGDSTSQSRLGPGGIYTFDNLFLLPGSRLEVNTSQPVTIKIREGGSVHIAAGAKLCNVKGFGQTCGNGDSSQLTIIQGSTSRANQESTAKMQCDISDRPSSQHTAEASSTSATAESFVVESTGAANESLNAFIYGPASTLVSSGVTKSWNYGGRYQWRQWHGSQHTLSVVNKGGYFYVAQRTGSSSANLFPLIDEQNRHIEANTAKKNNHYYSGIGQKWSLPTYTRYYPIYIPNNIIVRHNTRSSSITTHGLTINGGRAKIESARPIQYWSYSRVPVCGWQYSWYYDYYLRRYRYYRYWNCSYQTSWRRTDLIPHNTTETQFSSNLNALRSYYNLELRTMWNDSAIANAPRRFKGAAWMRNTCFSREHANSNTRKDWINASTPHTWEFSGSFIDGIVSRYGQEYNYGLPQYRAQGETIVDPQRLLSQ